MKKYIAAIAALILIFLLFTGCTAFSNYAKSINSDPTAIVIPALLNTPEATPTPSPTESTMPAIMPGIAHEGMIDFENITQEQEEEINKKFKEFLNGKGQFSDKSLWSSIISDLYYEPGKKSEKTKLGTIEYMGDEAIEYAMVEGVLLFYGEKDKDFYLINGYQNKKGKRFINIDKIPFSYFLAEGPGLSINYYRNHSRTSSIKSKDLTNAEEIRSLLSANIDKPLVYTFLTKFSEEIPTVSPGEIMCKNALDDNRALAMALWKPRIVKKEIEIQLKKAGEFTPIDIDKIKSSEDISYNNAFTIIHSIDLCN